MYEEVGGEERIEGVMGGRGEEEVGEGVCGGGDECGYEGREEGRCMWRKGPEGV